MMVTDPTKPNPPAAPNCLKCEYFAVTWDAKFPRSCKVFGIKSRNLPSWAVHRSTGKHCPAFSLSSKIKERSIRDG
jgi:hypothetical protein